jgi:hypothetical protein
MKMMTMREDDVFKEPMGSNIEKMNGFRQSHPNNEYYKVLKEIMNA